VSLTLGSQFARLDRRIKLLPSSLGVSLLIERRISIPYQYVIEGVNANVGLGIAKRRRAAAAFVPGSPYPLSLTAMHHAPCLNQKPPEPCYIATHMQSAIIVSGSLLQTLSPSGKAQSPFLLGLCFMINMAMLSNMGLIFVVLYLWRAV
jgi:hypothetical protein